MTRYVNTKHVQCTLSLTVNDIQNNLSDCVGMIFTSFFLLQGNYLLLSYMSSVFCEFFEIINFFKITNGSYKFMQFNII